MEPSVVSFVKLGLHSILTRVSLILFRRTSTKHSVKLLIRWVYLIITQYFGLHTLVDVQFWTRLNKK
ncbi:hypothetical protein Ahy_B04g070027 isoform H [Arachis hypogaea]|uniref:Uncharacterized protein n=1 Tax=Arachis hypogaea TaxID=3818 RepID=A0A444ZE90_ARAHY|nr:hypothetical protein Ahy_B04g070027 isoform H [Arachis hypogaea]